MEELEVTLKLLEVSYLPFGHSISKSDDIIPFQDYIKSSVPSALSALCLLTIQMTIGWNLVSTNIILSLKEAADDAEEEVESKSEDGASDAKVDFEVIDALPKLDFIAYFQFSSIY